MSPSSTKNNLQTTARQLLEKFLQSQWLKDAANRFEKEQQAGDTPTEFHLENLANPSVKTMAISALFRQLRRPVVVICPDPHLVQKYRYDFLQYLPADSVEAYPTEEYSPYDLSIYPLRSLQDQHRILHRLQKNIDTRNSDPFILLLSPKNLLLKHLSLEETDRLTVRLKTNHDISPDALSQQLLDLGYVKTSLIMDPGEFSSRGDIFDVYPVNAEPVRMEFFGDGIESMRRIDISNQRSIESVSQVAIIPRSGIVLSPENREKLAVRAQDQLSKQAKKLEQLDFEGLSTTLVNQLQALSQTFHPDGIDYYAPLVHMNKPDDYRTVIDYLPEESLVVFDDWHVFLNHIEGLGDRLTRQLDEGIEKGRLLDLDFRSHLTSTEALSRLQHQAPSRFFLDSFPTDLQGTKSSLDVRAPEQFKANMPQAAEYIRNLRRKGEQVFITTEHPQRVLDTCKEEDIPAVYWAEDGISREDASWHQLDVIISKKGPQDGFVLPQEKIVHLTDTELFGRRQKKLIFDQHGGRKREDVDVINSINDLRPGDYVVHEKHGIGQFLELSRITMDGETREYLSVQYSGSDRLYVPIDQVNLLSRYRGSGEKAPKLNKMGGIDWGTVKRKAQKSIQVIAKDLMELYARRSKVRGFHFDGDTPWQVEMEESFPYTETPDQWQAILDVKKDMESDKPMDRLICGDVGFGKTEVALRSIFKCVLSGKQAAILVPTTILAQQHFNTISDRLKPYPMKVGLLSRFRSPKEQKEVVQKITLGECDIVVGTHRLLQKDINFKDLGLLVIDEEHRFGVTHKEKIKMMKTEVDVLTLSATPIPRTLYMSLSGVRDMSLINTPPVNRLPIQTFVGPYNPAQIRMAILQELDRGGQIYFVHNRIQSIYRVAEELSQLVPEVKIAVAHGQMSGDQLENIMLDFSLRQFDVLLCTTIIESGVDIPNVNTMIVDDANRFGLAQLYQIRGRVGRSDVQAYCYCYYQPEKLLTTEATDRLRAIREFTTLGSGYQIAMRDLEIRGVGNVLGAEQHGHMVAVGFDLYCQMLEDSLQELKGEEVKRKESSIIDLNVTAYIPEEWAGDRDVKLTEYKRLADIDSELALEIIMAEWKDRFGDIPKETLQLVKLVQLRILATQLGIPAVRADEDYIRLTVNYTLQEWMYLQNKLPPELGRKARWVPPVASRQGSQPALLIKHLGMDGEEQVMYLMELLQSISKLQQEVAA